MFEYEEMRPLYEYFAMQKTSKKHWNDNFGQTIVEFLHQEVLQANKATIGACYRLTTIARLFCMMIMESVVWVVITLVYVVG